MITNVIYNPETKETTTVTILTKEDEPCGRDTGYVFNTKQDSAE